MSVVTVAMIPLRGGSKSIPDKNVRVMAGRPLCAWVLQSAVDAAQIDRVYVSTDSDRIKATVQSLSLGIEIVDRPPEFATDEASTESVMLHVSECVQPFDRLVTIQATSPLLEHWQLDEALEKFDAGRYDSMLSVVRSKRFFWREDGTPLNYDPLHRPRRQDFAGALMENGAFYVTTRTLLASSKCRLGGRVGVYEMPEDSATEVDDPRDWETVANLLEQRMGRIK